jgi:hypothetical protein
VSAGYTLAFLGELVTSDEFFARCEAVLQEMQRDVDRIRESQAETFRIVEQGLAGIRDAIDRINALLESTLR